MPPSLLPGGQTLAGTIIANGSGFITGWLVGMVLEWHLSPAQAHALVTRLTWPIGSWWATYPGAPVTWDGPAPWELAAWPDRDTAE